MIQSGLQAIKLLTEAGRVWKMWQSLDDDSRRTLKAEGIELKEAVLEAQKASVMVIHKTQSSFMHRSVHKRRVKALEQTDSSRRLHKILDVMSRPPEQFWSPYDISLASRGTLEWSELTSPLALLDLHGLVIDNGQGKYKYKTQDDWLAASLKIETDKELVVSFLKHYADACMMDGLADIAEKGMPSQRASDIDDRRLRAIVGAAVEMGIREGILYLYDLKGSLTRRRKIVGLPPESLQALEPTAQMDNQDAPPVIEAAARLAKAAHKFALHLGELRGEMGMDQYGTDPGLLGFPRPPEHQEGMRPQSSLDGNP